MRFASSIRPILGRSRLSLRPVGHDLLRDMVEFWPLSEQLGDRLGVHGGLTLTDTNTVTGADGVGSLASQFTQANAESLNRASETALQGGNSDWCFAFWALWSTTGSPTDGGRAISKRSAPTSNDYDIFRFAGDIYLLVHNSGGSGLQVPAAFSSDTWHFVVAWHDAAADTINIKVDANATVTQATAGLAPNEAAGGFRIGELAEASAPWNGAMQRVGYWKRVLTADELAFLYNSGRGRDYPFS